MDIINYGEYIDFSKLDLCMRAKGIDTQVEMTRRLAEFSDGGYGKSYIGSVIHGLILPTTGAVAKICCILKSPVSAIVSFSGIDYLEAFKVKEFKEPTDAVGLPTYLPLREFIYDFYKDRPKEERKTLRDLYDTLPHRPPRTNGFKKQGEGCGRVSIGMSPPMRAKINKDKSIPITFIYDICKKLRCNVDYVMSYK